ncbi:MAG: C_GCAxxG_C_C family protein [Ruminococcaceae bacterium]|nr:C_GCAxxG_C_C family protein [Oscillospiraceae bacterium]
MTKGEKAKSLFLEGYNCAQAVFGAFADDLSLDFEFAMKLSSGFGGGMGRLREVCGAVSGMFMVLDMKHGYTSPTDVESKKKLYSHIQNLAKSFEKENGSIICKELLGLSEKKSDPTPQNRTQEYYKKRPCAELVEIAANIVDDYLKNM